MRKFLYLLALGLLLLPPVVSRADRVKMQQGNQQPGKIVEINPTEIVLEVGANKRTLSVNDIDTVTFEGEPNDLTQARIAVHAGRYDDAATLLGRIDVGDLKREAIVVDVEFYKAITAARLALAGSGSKADAGKKLLAFEKSHRQSFHYFAACESVGDLLTSLGKYTEAESFYKKLADAPWPAYKLRAGVLIGRTLLGQKQYERAGAQFDDVLKMDAAGKDADRQKLAAALGKADALAASGQTAEATKLVDEIIAKADPENAELHARAYNILGNCQRAAGKKKEALLAFLHVDLLYSKYAEQHAEALANLATLWAELDKADRATQARNTLEEKYPHSAWAQK